MRNVLTVFLITLSLMLASCNKHAKEYASLSPDVFRDKIAGGWAGKMLGVTYGAPTEFNAKGKMYENPITWKPTDVKGSIWQDDIYVQLTFLMAMDKYGVHAPSKKFQELFAKAGYPLWHANVQARKNYFDSIFPPLSGSPDYSIHADDIDFQIEADYIGFMCPGMPHTAVTIADTIGHIMNYGDGVYGGIFVAALYSEAFFQNDIQKLIEKALESIPAGSEYAQIVRDMLLLHTHYPANWRDAWKELEAKWGDVDICAPGDSYNIDAKLNGAYIVMGLLYGDGDPLKTMEIATRCGQDSDCNPSNAMAVLGVIKGLSNLPADMQSAVAGIADSLFINTNYSFNKAVESTYQYAVKLVIDNGGSVSDKEIKIKRQDPVPPSLEISFPELVFNKRTPIFEPSAFSLTGKWNNYSLQPSKDAVPPYQSKMAEKAGDALAFKFTGTGISLVGNWFKDGGKADIFIDGKFIRSIDTYFFYSGQQHTDMDLFHILNLTDAEHTLKLVVKGEKRPESLGTRVYISNAIVFKTGPKKNEGYKFSFE